MKPSNESQSKGQNLPHPYQSFYDLSRQCWVWVYIANCVWCLNCLFSFLCFFLHFIRDVLKQLPAKGKSFLKTNSPSKNKQENHGWQRSKKRSTRNTANSGQTRQKLHKQEHPQDFSQAGILQLRQWNQWLPLLFWIRRNFPIDVPDGDSGSSKESRLLAQNLGRAQGGCAGDCRCCSAAVAKEKQTEETDVIWKKSTVGGGWAHDTSDQSQTTWPKERFQNQAQHAELGRNLAFLGFGPLAHILNPLLLHRDFHQSFSNF